MLLGPMLFVQAWGCDSTYVHPGGGLICVVWYMHNIAVAFPQIMRQVLLYLRSGQIVRLQRELLTHQRFSKR